MRENPLHQDATAKPAPLWRSLEPDRLARRIRLAGRLVHARSAPIPAPHGGVPVAGRRRRMQPRPCNKRSCRMCTRRRSWWPAIRCISRPPRICAEPRRDCWSRAITGGRPKIEGNPSHPGSLGATDIFAQAAVLDLWDPDRAQAVLHRGQVSTWDAFVAALSAQAQRPVRQRRRPDCAS